MKNIMKVVIMVVILAMAMMMSGFAYEKEEASDALIEELISEGFEQSETNSNLWEYTEDMDDGENYATIYAAFDTDTNMGIIHMYGEWAESGTTYHNAVFAARWNCELDDFETLSEIYN